MDYKKRNKNKKPPVKKNPLDDSKQMSITKESKTIDFRKPPRKPLRKVQPNRQVNSGTNANTNANAKRKRKTFNPGISYSSIAVLAVFFAVIVLYLLGGVFELVNRSHIPTITVEYGSVDRPDTYEGMIIRDEKVYKSNATGTVNFIYDNMDKVSNGSTVCTIQDQTKVDELNKELEQSNQQILELQEKRGDYSAYSQEVERANQQIQYLIDDSMHKLSQDGFSEVYSLKENVEQSMDIRNQMLLSEDNGSVKNLVDEQNAIEGQLSENIAVINAEESGILSYYIDGQEEALNFENMNEITPEQVGMEVNYEDLESNKEVVPEDNIFKIVESNDWYVAVYAPNKVIEQWEIGDYRNINIEKNGEFVKNEMYVQNIVPGEKESLILLKSSKNMIDYLNMRNVNVKLVDTSQQGVKIPASAIVDKTLFVIPNEFVVGGDEPYVVKKGTDTSPDQTIPIKIHATDETNTYIFKDENIGLNMSDILVKSDDKTKEYTISEVKNVKGVFLYDNGYADFEEINMGENTPDSAGYVVLDIEQNQNIPINSKIIADPSNIQNGQELN